MSTEELDGVVARIIQEAREPLTLPQIESRVIEQRLPADTYDVQRSVQRLVSVGRAKLTPYFLIAAADPTAP
jgi:hypothetical protein